MVCNEEKRLGIFHITRTGRVLFEEYAGFVIVAENEDTALKMTDKFWDRDGKVVTSWGTSNEIIINYLGEAAHEIEAGIIMEDVNYG